MAHPVNGSDGLRVKEIAFAKHIHSIKRSEDVLDSLFRQCLIEV